MLLIKNVLDYTKYERISGTWNGLFQFFHNMIAHTSQVYGLTHGPNSNSTSHILSIYPQQSNGPVYHGTS